jgi:hypothetical protein
MIRNQRPHSVRRRLAVVSLQGLEGVAMATGDPQTPGTVEYRPPADPSQVKTTIGVWEFMGRAAATLTVLALGQSILSTIGGRNR